MHDALECNCSHKNDYMNYLTGIYGNDDESMGENWEPDTPSTHYSDYEDYDS